MRLHGFSTGSTAAPPCRTSETGGLAIVNQNDFDKALKRIDQETSDYYLLGFYSSNPDPLRRSRRLTVTVVGRPGLSVKHPPGYSLRPVARPDSLIPEPFWITVTPCGA